MKLYVCWNQRLSNPGFGEHPCGTAAQALRDAGHDPKVIRSYGWMLAPDFFNFTRGRREVKRLTGSFVVPVLVTDDGEVVRESQPIIDWAKQHPAATTTA